MTTTEMTITEKSWFTEKGWRLVHNWGWLQPPGDNYTDGGAIGFRDDNTFTILPEERRGRWVYGQGVLLLKFDDNDTCYTGQLVGCVVTGICTKFSTNSLGCFYLMRKGTMTP